jgi:DNA-binding MarR family transcriptional regulator
MTKSKPKNRVVAAEEIANRLHSAAIHLLRRVRVSDQAAGIGPAQLSALSVLVFGGPRSLGELADAEQVRPPTMSRIVVGLEQAGLLRRKKTEDKRRMLLEATAKGHKVLQEGRKRRVESLAAAVRSLTPAETEQLQDLAGLLEKVILRL